MLGYLILLAQPTYETEAKLIVRENHSGSAAPISGLPGALLGIGSKTSLEDALIIENYLHSAAFIELAAERFSLREHFSDAPHDPFRRLAHEAPSETFYEFFRKSVSIGVKPESSILTIRVRAFSPTVTQELAQFIIERSEEIINSLNERMVASQTALAQRELVQSQERLVEVKEKLLQFQISHAMVDPAGETTTYFGNIAALDSRLVEKRTDQRIKAQYLRDDAFEIRRLRQEIIALEAQRKEETRVLVTQEGTGMATTLLGYENLKMQKEFALAAYSSAFAMAENAMLEAARQEKFLLVIAPPYTPEKSVFPRPARGAAMVFILSCIGYGIVRLILATIGDHTI